jgi:hypothetical protein
MLRDWQVQCFMDEYPRSYPTAVKPTKNKALFTHVLHFHSEDQAMYDGTSQLGLTLTIEEGPGMAQSGGVASASTLAHDFQPSGRAQRDHSIDSESFFAGHQRNGPPLIVPNGYY